MSRQSLTAVVRPTVAVGLPATSPAGHALALLGSDSRALKHAHLQRKRAGKGGRQTHRALSVFGTPSTEVIVARLPRHVAPGMPQHVVQRGNNRSACFAADSDYRFFRDCLQSACEHHGCQVHAYAFMTNHVHLLLTPTSDVGVARLMQCVGRRYVRRFNTTYQRTGTLWEGRYRATLVESARYLLACYRYIELNPVRGRLVSDPRDYRWSSYTANAFGVSDALVTPHEEYRGLGSDPSARRAAYRALFDTALTDDAVGAIRDATNKGWALGSERFREEIATLLGRRTQPAWAGPLRRRSAGDG